MHPIILDNFTALLRAGAFNLEIESIEPMSAFKWAKLLDVAEKLDVKNYIENEIDIEKALLEAGDIDSLKNNLYDDLFCNDSVTGNASGSYTFSTWQAEENLCHNMDLLKEALEEFGCGIEYLEKGAEACDVTIRCYLLSSAISEVIDELGLED